MAQGRLGKAKGMGQRADWIQRWVLGSTPVKYAPVKQKKTNKFNGVNFAITIVNFTG